jgi:acyl-homoserine lactone acylase PvdQ
MGKTVAEDRLWQMENSRHVARGRAAELLGLSAVAGDKDTILTGYTDDEYAEMFGARPGTAKTAFL